MRCTWRCAGIAQVRAFAQYNFAREEAFPLAFELEAATQNQGTAPHRRGPERGREAPSGADVFRSLTRLATDDKTVIPYCRVSCIYFINEL